MNNNIVKNMHNVEYSLLLRDGFIKIDTTFYKMNSKTLLLFLVSFDNKNCCSENLYFECIPIPMLFFLPNSDKPLGGCFNVRNIARIQDSVLSSTQDLFVFFRSIIYPRFISLSSINECLLYNRELFLASYGRLPSPSKEEIFAWIKAGSIQEAINACNRFLECLDNSKMSIQQSKKTESMKTTKLEIIDMMKHLKADNNFYNQQIEQLIAKKTKRITNYLNGNTI